nr:MAG TPA: hypothetical protein [Caudoviricetes sp.]
MACAVSLLPESCERRKAQNRIPHAKRSLRASPAVLMIRDTNPPNSRGQYEEFPPEPDNTERREWLD